MKGVCNLCKAAADAGASNNLCKAAGDAGASNKGNAEPDALNSNWWIEALSAIRIIIRAARSASCAHSYM